MKKLFLLFIAALLPCFAERPTTKEMRDLWTSRIQGTNLALGKKCQLVPAPDYHLTKSDTDPFDLTDGAFASKSEERLWFYKGAVGWYESIGHSFIKVDLEEVQPIEKLVIRLLGGSTGNFKFPSWMTVHVSKDGKLFHEAVSMQKLAPCESDQCDWKRYFYIEEDLPWGRSWTYPFELFVQAEARYVILEIKAESGSIFSDEMAIIKAEIQGPDFNAAYKTDGLEIPMDGLLIRPRVHEIVVMPTLPTAQKLMVTDLRPDKVKNKDFGKLIMEFPKGVKIINEREFTVEETASGTKYICDLTRSKGKTPSFYLDAKATAKGNVTIYAETSEGPQFKSVVPLKIVQPIKITKPFERLHISLSWMGENAGRAWPNFFENWRSLGFNVVSTFPRYWSNEGRVKEGGQYVDDAHAAGFKVIMNESCFHVMTNGKKEGHEMFCQIPGKENKWLCPSYRGEYYQKEMERVARCVRNSKPDYVFYDIEIWHKAKTSALKCTRCQAKLKESGKSLEDFLFECGKETVADLKIAVQRGAEEAGIPMPVLGSYNRHAASKAYAIERWEEIYPASIDMAQPSLYVCGRAQDVHNCIRRNYNILGNKKIVPWLTAGTYGEFDSYKMEQMVLEALMNGASGITYYKIENFYDSPLDFYYHAKALAEIRPYEDLVMDGVPTEITGSNAELTYSMLLKGNELLLMVGNYRGATPATTVKLPFKAKEVLDLREGKPVSATGETIAFDVPKNEIRLFYISK